MGRVLDIAASHYSHISIAMGESNQIFMWGECLGQSITIPMLTGLRCIHDAFARYASPNVMHQPLILHGEEETVGLIDCFKEAFNDQVCICNKRNIFCRVMYFFKNNICLCFIGYE